MTLDQEIHALQSFLLQGEGSSFALAAAQQRLSALLLQRASMGASTPITPSVIKKTKTVAALPAHNFSPQAPLTLAAASTLEAVTTTLGNTNTLGACQIGMDCMTQEHPELAPTPSLALVSQPADLIGDQVSNVDLAKFVGVALLAVAGLFALNYVLRRR